MAVEATDFSTRHSKIAHSPSSKRFSRMQTISAASNPVLKHSPNILDTTDRAFNHLMVDCVRMIKVSQLHQHPRD
jgi:hypothetical protein